MPDMTKSTLPNKSTRDLADELMDRFPDVNPKAWLREMIGHYFFKMKHGNKREERAACEFLNVLQQAGCRLSPPNAAVSDGGTPFAPRPGLEGKP